MLTVESAMKPDFKTKMITINGNGCSPAPLPRCIKQEILDDEMPDCDECNKSEDGPSEDTVKMVDDAAAAAEFEIKELDSTACGQPAERSRCTIKPTPGKLFSCKQCGKVIYNGGGLRKHLRQRAAEQELRKKPLACNKCDKKFTSNGRLQQHQLNIHSVATEDQLQCWMCPETFRQLVQLSDHLRTIHTA